MFYPKSHLRKQMAFWYDEKDILGSFRTDLNSRINEASACADMKHSCSRAKHLLRKYEAKRTVTFPCAEGTLHRAKPSFIFHAPQVRFIEKSRLLSQTAFFLCHFFYRRMGADLYYQKIHIYDFMILRRRDRGYLHHILWAGPSQGSRQDQNLFVEC